MSSTVDLLHCIASADGLTLSELLAKHPDIARRTAQRLVAHLIENGQVIATGEARAKRYFSAPAVTTVSADQFSFQIPVSADSRDILAYVDRPLEARKPVGYQRDFPDAYQPNKSWYLPEPLRRQLHRMGKTSAADKPAGTTVAPF